MFVAEKVLLLLVISLTDECVLDVLCLKYRVWTCVCIEVFQQTSILLDEILIYTQFSL